MDETRGANLAVLLLSGFESMVDEVIEELAQHGHRDVRAVHEFAIRAIDAGADTASELGRRLSVTKQAAAKTIATLEHLGYVIRASDPSDGRRKRLVVTARGYEMSSLGAHMFNNVRAKWAAEIGEQRLAGIEADLTRVIKPRLFTTGEIDDNGPD